jgi:hypothetical protein
MGAGGASWFLQYSYRITILYGITMLDRNNRDYRRRGIISNLENLSTIMAIYEIYITMMALA